MVAGSWKRHELAARRLPVGDHRTAEAAIFRGLAVATEVELLHRDLFYAYASAAPATSWSRGQPPGRLSRRTGRDSTRHVAASANLLSPPDAVRSAPPRPGAVPERFRPVRSGKPFLRQPWRRHHGAMDHACERVGNSSRRTADHGAKVGHGSRIDCVTRASTGALRRGGFRIDLMRCRDP
ncbi:hypothetical protein GCM10020229_28380 [Kitasatospora albolonga]